VKYICENIKVNPLMESSVDPFSNLQLGADGQWVGSAPGASKTLSVLSSVQPFILTASSTFQVDPMRKIMAWKLDPKVIRGETMLNGIEFTVVTATEERVMKPPFTLATNGRIDVTYSEGGPPTVTDDQGNTLCASGDSNKASPTSHGTLLAASASKSGSITPAISGPDSEAQSFFKHLRNVNDWYLPSNRTP
jgi:hypothetical protein